MEDGAQRGHSDNQKGQQPELGKRQATHPPHVLFSPQQWMVEGSQMESPRVRLLVGACREGQWGKGFRTLSQSPRWIKKKRKIGRVN